MDIKIIKGDITKAKVDAIVNAANSRLAAGGGVCGAIFSACDDARALQRECDSVAPCPVGEARITGSYGLTCKHIIHAVGPIYRNDAESAPLLASAYRSSLELAYRYNLESIAFPSISTGIFGYPLDKAVIIALNTIKLYTTNRLKECYIYCFDDRTYNVFKKTLAH